MTDSTPDNAPDSDPTIGPQTARIVYGILVALTIAVAAVAFVLSFVGLRDYGIRLMGLTPGLAALVPLGVDLFSLCGIASTYLLARAPTRVRLYAWTVFLVPAALSVAGNIAHAHARDLASAGTVGAALAPVVLALAAHLVVVVRRHLFRDSVLTVRPDSAMVALPDMAQQLTPVIEVDPTPDTGQRPRPHNAVDDDVRIDALARLARGADLADVASDIGVDRRTVQRWADGVAEAARTRRPKVRTQRPHTRAATSTSDSEPAEPVAVPETASPAVG